MSHYANAGRMGPAGGSRQDPASIVVKSLVKRSEKVEEVRVLIQGGAPLDFCFKSRGFCYIDILKILLVRIFSLIMTQISILSNAIRRMLSPALTETSGGNARGWRDIQNLGELDEKSSLVLSQEDVHNFFVRIFIDIFRTLYAIFYENMDMDVHCKRKFLSMSIEICTKCL